MIQLPPSPSMYWNLLVQQQFARMPFPLSPALQQAFRAIDRAWFVSKHADGLFNSQTKEEALHEWKELQKRTTLSGPWSILTQNGKESLELEFSDGTITGKGTFLQNTHQITGTYDLVHGSFQWTMHDTFPITFRGSWRDQYIEGEWISSDNGGSFALRTDVAPPSCYVARPVFLGFGVNNSSPYMHIIGLLHIQDLLSKPGISILDVGCGSGFITAILAAAAENPKEILGVDHVEEFVEKAPQLISWFCPQLSQKVSFECMDARYGCGTNRFDIIHLGAAPNSLQELEPLIYSLKTGGKLIGPVTIQSSQRFVLITKEENGYHTQDLFGVIYTVLQDLADQY